MIRPADGPSLATTALTWLALAILAALVLAVGIGLFPVSESMAHQFPEFAGLRAPLLTLSIGILVCVETALVTTAFLVSQIRQHKIFGATAARMVDLLIITVLVATFLTAATLPYLPGPPALMIVVVGAVLVGIALLLVLIVLRSLLRRTVLMRMELDEVV